MKNKRIFKVLIILSVILLLVTGTVYGAGAILKYKFNKIEKVSTGNYNYIAKPVNVLQDDWLTNFAGGRKKTLKVGIGHLIYNDNAENTEAYLDLEGNGNRITLIANGANYEYYDGTQQIKKKTINFFTGKKLVGKEVVKDYSDGKLKIVLIIDYSENGIGTPRVLFCSQNDNEDNPKNNYYELKLNN